MTTRPLPDFAAGPASQAVGARVAAALAEKGPPPGGFAVLGVRDRRRFVTLPQGDILLVTSAEAVMTVVTLDGRRYWTDLTLGALAVRLDPRRFYRLDASTVVNVAAIAELVPHTHQRYVVRFADAAKTERVVSRDVGRRLRAALGW